MNFISAITNLFLFHVIIVKESENRSFYRKTMILRCKSKMQNFFMIKCSVLIFWIFFLIFIKIIICSESTNFSGISCFPICIFVSLSLLCRNEDGFLHFICPFIKKIEWFFFPKKLSVHLLTVLLGHPVQNEFAFFFFLSAKNLCTNL